MKKNILVIAAHPDDEILGCGGTINGLTKKNYNVYSLVLGSGIDSRFKTINKKKKISLHQQCIRANKILGVKKVFLENLKDNRLDNYDLLDIVKLIESYIEKIKPSIIFTHCNKDLNIDHQITFRASLTAARPMKNRIVKKFLCFETVSSTEWSFGKFNGGFNPSVFFDIDESIKIKLKSLAIYRSEMRKFPHPRSLQNIKNLSMLRGSSIGCRFAEAFECVFDIQ